MKHESITSYPRRRNSQMDFTGRTSSEEGEDCKVGRKGGHSFLGCTRYNSYRLSSVEANNQWRLLCILLDRFNNILKKKRFHLAKKKVLLHQDNTGPAPIAKFNEFCYELLSYPAYSPSATISCYFRT